MRLLREAFPAEPALEVELARVLLERVSAGEERSSLRVYRPGRSVAFGPQDRLVPGYAPAREAARRQGFAPVERLAGGRAAVYHEGTVALALTLRDPAARQHIREHFETSAWLIADALRSLGVDARVGAVPGEYCPGSYSVNAGGRVKIAGVAQRVASNATHIGVVIVADGQEAIREVLTPVYAALGLTWDPTVTGSVAAVAPGITLDEVAAAIIRSFGKEYAIDEGTLPPGVLASARAQLSRAGPTVASR